MSTRGHLDEKGATGRYVMEREHDRVGRSVELFAAGQWFNRGGPNRRIAWRISRLNRFGIADPDSAD